MPIVQGETTKNWSTKHNHSIFKLVKDGLRIIARDGNSLVIRSTGPFDELVMCFHIIFLLLQIPSLWKALFEACLSIMISISF